MSRTHSRRRVLRAAGTGLVAGLAGCVGSGGASPEERARTHREALSKYHDVGVALEDGYTMGVPYVRTNEGVLGLPFINIDTPDLEPEQPSVLFYNLREDGTYALLGVEWLIPANEADSPPSMFGKQLDDATPGETEFIPDHYGLHAWLFEDNPDGLFATYHTGATPPSFIDDLETAWDALSPFYTNEAKAQEAGYVSSERCISTSDGTYGIPYVNTEYAGTTPDEPAALMYRLSASWAYQLIGVEWYVPADSVSSPPSLFGREFHGPVDGHSQQADQPPHYGLHAWLFAANPEGMFARYNPHITC